MTSHHHPPTPRSPSKMSQAVLRRNSPILVAHCEEMNPSKRSSMEDCSVYSPPGTWDAPDPEMAYLGIYDGHGGRDMVEYLEHGLSFHVAQELQVVDDDATISERLERAFLMADIHSKQLGVKTSGATVAVCLIKKPRRSRTISLYTANAGDARIVLGHQGKATRLTRDHRPEDADEVERIEQAGGFLFKGRVIGVLAITRSLGDHCMKQFVIAEPYCYEMQLELGDYYHPVPAEEERNQSSSTAEKGNVVPADSEQTRDQHSTPPPSNSFVICACDGLWDVFEDQDAVDFVWEHRHEPDYAAKRLVEEALRKGSTDNISVLVAWL